MYAHPFSYHRAKTLAEASKLLRELGDESRVLAGGQSLIPLMKMRLARPTALIDINFVPGLSEIQNHNGGLRLGALARHTELEMSEAVAAVPILHDSWPAPEQRGSRTDQADKNQRREES